MHSQALVQGFVIANYQLGKAGDNVRVVFNQQVAEQLKQNSKLHRVARVPGSWRDF
jgi:protein subunit release factor A